jgi:type VI protein secretion system component VasK
MSMSTSGDTDAQPDDEDQSLEERLADLEEEVEYLRSSRDRYRQEIVQPRLDDLQAASDDAREGRAELRAMVEDMQKTIATLQQTLENMAGLEDPSQTSPDKRVQDLAQAMTRRAQASDTAGARMWMGEVQDLFAELGHGKISKPDCYKAMDQLVERDGFEYDTKHNQNGNEVKAVRLKSAALPADEGSSNPTTREEGTTRLDHENRATEIEQ